MARYFLLTLLLLIFSQVLFAQDTLAVKKEAVKKKRGRWDGNPALMIVPNYTGQFPFGNMKERFGFNSLFDGQFGYKTKRNWIVSGDGGFIYGTDVKENYILNGIATSTGQFITQYNDITNVRLEEHGFNVQFKAGKIIPFAEKYPDAGLLIMTGAGFLEHKIAINVKASELPQLSPVYKKGYDRMSNGPVVSQFIGGTFMARRKYISGYAGFQFDAAYTEGRRPYDFYLMQPLHDKRADLFVGFKIGYIIPVFLQTSEKEYFYY
jgi:hypothetical protein